MTNKGPYFIVEGNNPGDLMAKVNEIIEKERLEVVGSPFEHGRKLYQAMLEISIPAFGGEDER